MGSHEASELDFLDELFLDGLSMDHNLSKIIAAARCRPNKPPERRSLPEKGHLGSFGKRSCMLFPVRLWMTPAPDGSEELSLPISAYRFQLSDFLFFTHVPKDLFSFLRGTESHTAADAVSNCMHWLSFIDFYCKYERRDRQGCSVGDILNGLNTDYRSHPESPVFIP